MAAPRTTAVGRHGIRQRVVSVVLAATLGLIALLGWVGWRSIARVRDQFVSERSVLARSVALQVEQLFDDELASLAAVGLDLDFVSDPQVIEYRLKDAYRRSRLFTAVFVVRLDGSSVLSVPPSSGAIDADLEAAARAAAGTPRAAITRIGRPDAYALFLVPLHEAGRPVAIVGGVLPPDSPHLTRLLAAAAPHATGFVELHDAAGRTAARGGAGVPADVRLLSADAAVDQLGWTVTVRQPEADVLAPLYGVRRVALLLSPILFGIAILLAWGSAASVVRPLGQLTRAAEQIALGNLDTPVPFTGRDEAGRLGRALDDMRVALKTSISQIETANEQLERRVDERTSELNRLYDELRARDRLRGELLKKAISAQEDERKRVARELHDETSQMVNALLMELDAALAQYPSAFSHARLTEVRQLAARLLDGVHRLILDLRPSMLDDLGLVSAIEWFARRQLEPRGVAVRFEASGTDFRLPRETELALFRVAQETLTNVARHARADAVLVQCTATDTQFTIDIEDDGEGFDVTAVTTDPTSLRGLGLAGMRERVSLVNGQIDIDSAPGDGTRVVITVPLTERGVVHV